MMETKKLQECKDFAKGLMGKKYMLFMKVINSSDSKLLVLDSPKDTLDILENSDEKEFETLIIRKKNNIMTHSIIEAKQILQKELHKINKG